MMKGGIPLLTKFYDTNALLLLLDEAFKEKFLCSNVTLLEIESIKTSSRKDDEVKYRARKLSHLFDEHSDMYAIIMWDENMHKNTYDLTNDIKIVECACAVSKDSEVIFVSDDICAKNIARSIFGLTVECAHDKKDEIYKGYKIIKGNSDYINDLMCNMDLSEWSVNEYLIIQNTDDNSEKEMRFDGTGFVALKLPSSKFVKAKNSLQRCALDILNNQDITVAAILGTYGSGKSHLCMKMALYHVNEKGNQSKILGVRELRGEGLEPGYLPGDLDDKTGFFFAPLAQQLEGGEFELESLKQRGILDFQIPYFLKGTTYSSTIILPDEAEDLKESQIRLIGTRLGENSRIFFSGDYKQSLLDKSNNNALIKMCSEFRGNPKFGCICLDTDVRSDTSKMFTELFVN